MSIPPVGASQDVRPPLSEDSLASRVADQAKKHLHSHSAPLGKSKAKRDIAAERELKLTLAEEAAHYAWLHTEGEKRETATIFGKIIAGELPCEKVFESPHFLVIKDIAPVAPVHFLLIPKKGFPNLQTVEREDRALLSELIGTAQQLAREHGIAEDYCLFTNNGRGAGQVIFHLHFHLVGGKQISVPTSELPSEPVFEDERLLVREDPTPSGSVQFQITPKKRFLNLQALEKEDLPLIGEVVEQAQELAKTHQFTSSYRFFVNSGREADQLTFYVTSGSRRIEFS